MQTMHFYIALICSKSRWNMHLYFFMKITIEKCIFSHPHFHLIYLLPIQINIIRYKCYHFATKRALYLATFHSSVCLIVKIHLHHIGCLHGGRSTSSQVLFFLKPLPLLAFSALRSSLANF